MDGYDKFAALVGDHDEMSIFRRFSMLNAKNLLYFQAELVNLEDELEKIVREDKASKDPEKQLFPYSLWHLKDSLRSLDGRCHTQWLKVLEIRQILKEYSQSGPPEEPPTHVLKRTLADMYVRLRPDNALLQQSQIAKFEAANKADLESLRDWLSRKNGGNFSLRGRDAKPWGDEHTGDLISLISHHRENDYFTLCIRDRFVPWFHKHIGYRTKVYRQTLLGHAFNQLVVLNISTKADDEEDGIWKYRESTINNAANAISVVVSSLLPTSTIFVLYFLHAPLAKLGAIVGFTALFSLALVIVVKARRIDAFAAATA
ncbi:MAG: hypothetical protein M1839_006372 [Geoglossum umbratile]|nr:MAG: hypothetical protein M1839_006372 [Geoglossum umbratile]